MITLDQIIASCLLVIVILLIGGRIVDTIAEMKKQTKKPIEPTEWPAIPIAPEPEVKPNPTDKLYFVHNPNGTGGLSCPYGDFHAADSPIKDLTFDDLLGIVKRLSSGRFSAFDKAGKLCELAKVIRELGLASRAASFQPEMLDEIALTKLTEAMIRAKTEGLQHDSKMKDYHSLLALIAREAAAEKSEK